MAKKYSEFENIYKWNTKDLYNSIEDCKKDINKLKNLIKSITKYKGVILKSSDNLYNLLELDTNISRLLERIYIYAHINNDADTLNSDYQELYGLAKNIYQLYLEKTSFIVPELLESDYEVIKNYYKENSKLKDYKRCLKQIFREKKHILSKNEEEILSSFTKINSSFEDIMGALTDSDFKFKPVIVDGKECELTESNFSNYLRNSDRLVRKTAFDNIYEQYGNYKTTLATILKNEIDKSVTMARLRKFPNTLEASLFSNELDSKVYYNLITSVHNNLDSLYKYWNLKKELLKIEELHIYDTYTDIIDNNNNEYSFSDAKKLVIEAVKPLGDDYVKDINKAFDEGWIDSCNNEGKRGGAYCTNCYDVHPYVLLSYEKSLTDVSTLIHELGHAMHYYYASHNQKYQDYDYSIFVAEVASQVNEILLSRYLLDHTNNNSEKLKIVDDLLQRYKATIFRQTMFAEFELMIHEYSEKGGVLTSEWMCDKYYELNKLYYGDGVYVDENIKYEWERIPHFYMNYYVWMYATGFAASIYLANNIYDGNKEVRDNYLKFLKLGRTKNPVDSLKVAGVDMTNSKVIDDSIKYMNTLIEEYSKLQKK